MRILLLSKDLMANSHCEGVARRLACEARVFGEEKDLLDALMPDDILVLDLALSGIDLGRLVTAARSNEASLSIVAFGPHVHKESLKRAQEAGCDLVVSRGQWDREAVSLCQSLRP